jgi:hypothetical protein
MLVILLEVEDVDIGIDIDIGIDLDERATAAAAGRYEAQFLVAQFNRMGKFMHVALLVLSWVLMAPY